MSKHNLYIRIEKVVTGYFCLYFYYPICVQDRVLRLNTNGKSNADTTNCVCSKSGVSDFLFINI